MSTLTLAKHLRALSYADMMILARTVSERIAQRPPGPIDAPLIADILSDLQIQGLQEATLQEEKILREIFSRKRTINVVRANAGWEIDVPTLPSGQVFGIELRPLFGLQLDQLITFHVLNKK